MGLSVESGGEMSVKFKVKHGHGQKLSKLYDNELLPAAIIM